MRQHQINEQDNFIGGWYINDTSICDQIIKFHNDMELVEDGTYKGIVALSTDTQCYVPEVKDSIDCILNKDPFLYNDYATVLQQVLDQYMEKYPRCNEYDPFSVQQYINIQKYNPGGGYHQWHTERAQAWPQEIASRHLVFMTYLNDVSDQGETEFLHQKVKVKPEKGLTLIWPADWTFTHRGIASHTQTKYIVTGWFNYIHT